MGWIRTKAFPTAATQLAIIAEPAQSHCIGRTSYEN